MSLPTGSELAAGRPFGLLIEVTGAGFDGAVASFRRGLDEALSPQVAGAIASWKGGELEERGLDLVISLGGPRYVDRVLLRQAVRREARVSESVGGATPAERPVGQAMEAAEVQVTAGIGEALAFARPAPGQPLRLVARRSAPDQGVLPATIVLELGVEASELVLSLESYRRDVEIASLEVWGAGVGEPRLYPQPLNSEPLPGQPFPLTDATTVVLSGDAGTDSSLAAALLRDKIGIAHGIDLTVGGLGTGQPAIRLGTPDELGEPALPPEGFRLRVTAEGVTLAGADRRGLVYAVEALLQLVTADEQGKHLEPLQVTDAPKMGIRGVHLYVPARENVPFFRRLIRYLLAPMRYNTIFLEVGAGMAFDRHPEINAAWEHAKALADNGEAAPPPHIEVGGGSFLSKAEMRELIDYAEAHGLDVIPEIQSLSHVEFITMAHPEVAEDPTDPHPDCYCPQNERSYEILFDNIDEIVEVFRPKRYVHMGHDEAYTMGRCEKCRGVPKAELFARDVNRIYEYLRGKGLGMMIWDDMVHTTRHFACPDALAMIPKDVVLLNFVWYDRTDLDTEVLLLQAGHPVVIGNFYSSHFPRFATREGKPGLVGAEVSTWYTASEEDYGRLGKLYDFIYSANMMWSPHYRDELRWLYDSRISALLPAVRDALAGAMYPSRRRQVQFTPLNLGEAAAAARHDERGTLGGYDLGDLPRGEATLGGVPFALGERVGLLASPRLREPAGMAEALVPLGGRCESVVFLQACTQPGVSSPYNGRAQEVARYTYVYADGTRAEIPVEYGWQLAEWDRRHGAPLSHSHWRHSGYVATYPALPFWQGKTPCGEDVTLYGYEWVNPYPEKVVTAVAVTVPAAAGDAALLLVAATAVTAEQRDAATL